jgi:peroxiredoxin
VTPPTRPWPAHRAHYWHRLASCVSLIGAIFTTSCTGAERHGILALSLGQVYPVAERVQAPNVTGTLLSGGLISLDQELGKVVVLNFWAAWCPPCRIETPQFDILYRRLKHRGAIFIGINTKDERSNARAFVHENKISFPIVFDEQGEFASRLGALPAIALPFTVLIDREGRIAAVYVAALTDHDLRRPLRLLLRS